jgi:hypothetical protein
MLQKLKYLLLTLVLLELFLGGTGRLLEFTEFLTLRMCLFIIYMALVVFYLFLRRTLPVEIVILTSLFIFINFFGAINGFRNGAYAADVFEDIKPLLNTFLFCYLAFSINSAKDITYVLNLLKFSAVILALLHIVLYGIYLYFQSITVLFDIIYSLQSDNTVFLFKGESGFLNYTGDIYLCIGFIAWDEYSKKSIFKYFMLALILTAIVLTGTRGLIISLAGVYLLKWLILKVNYRSIISICIGAVIMLVVFSNIQGNIGDKDESDQTRYDQINQVIERITPTSFIFGHGYGIGVPVRPVHMEISYLEIFHKQGILGISYYAMILLMGYIAYKNCKRENAIGFFMFILFIYFVSGTNPYVNHPLGITVLAISLVSMLKLHTFEKNEDLYLID